MEILYFIFEEPQSSLSACPILYYYFLNLLYIWLSEHLLNIHSGYGVVLRPEDDTKRQSLSLKRK